MKLPGVAWLLVAAVASAEPSAAAAPALWWDTFCPPAWAEGLFGAVVWRLRGSEWPPSWRERPPPAAAPVEEGPPPPPIKDSQSKPPLVAELTEEEEF